MTNIPYGHAGDAGAPAQPGRVYPLRRLGLGEVLAGGFSLIRHSPKAVLGVPFAAGLASFLIALLLFAVFPGNALFRMIYDPMAFEDPNVAAGAISEWSVLVLILLMALLQNLVLSIGYALVVVPALRAAYGFRTGFAQTVRLAAPRIGPLLAHILVMVVLVTVVAALVGGVVVGLLVLLGYTLGVLAAVIAGLLLLPAVLLLVCWLTAGLMYAPLVVVAERRGPVAAIGRSWALNKGLWWRNIGTIALIFVLMVTVSSVLTMPLSVLLGFGSAAAWMSGDPESGNMLSFVVLAASTFMDSVITAVLLGLSAAMISLIYVNCRVRREAFDVALLTAAERTVDDGETIPGSAAHLGELHPVPQQGRAHQTPGGFAWNPAAGQPGQTPGYGQSGYPGYHPPHHHGQPQQPGWPQQPGQQPPRWGPHSSQGGQGGYDGGTPDEQGGPRL